MAAKHNRYPGHGRLAATIVCTLGLLTARAEGQAGAPAPEKPSIGESIAQGFKQKAAKVGQALKPKKPVRASGDPISLSSPGKPSPRLFVALARLQEEEGRLSEAAERYEKALELDPAYPGALLGMARLQERLGHPLEAIKYYDRAAEANPEDASVANNRGLFYAKRKQYVEALASLEQAVKLKPTSAKYRHNIALVLVQVGRNPDALRHLRAVHAEAVAHYNLGYLLKTKGDERMAAFHFRQAAVADPSLSAAKYWLSRVEETSRQAQRPAAVPSTPARPPSRQAAKPAPSAQPVPRPQTSRAGAGSSPPHVADRSSGPPAEVRVMPPPPRRSAPLPAESAPQLQGPQLGGQTNRLGAAPMPPAMQPPMPTVTRPPVSTAPPLPPGGHRPPPVRRLPTVN